MHSAILFYHNSAVFRCLLNVSFSSTVLMPPGALYQLMGPWQANARYPYDFVLAAVILRIFGSNDQMFITCLLNESEESNVTPRSCNMGTNLIAVSLILFDQVSVQLPILFMQKVWHQFCHHSIVVCCGTSMSLHLKFTVLCC